MKQEGCGPTGVTWFIQKLSYWKISWKNPRGPFHPVYPKLRSDKVRCASSVRWQALAGIWCRICRHSCVFRAAGPNKGCTLPSPRHLSHCEQFWQSHLGVLLVSSAYKPGTLINLRQDAEQPPGQGIAQLRASVAPRLINPDLGAPLQVIDLTVKDLILQEH